MHSSHPYALLVHSPQAFPTSILHGFFVHSPRIANAFSICNRHAASMHSPCAFFMLPPCFPHAFSMRVAAGTDGPVYERALRDALGNDQDVSKVLRDAVDRGLVRREGRGGRGDPFR